MKRYLLFIISGALLLHSCKRSETPSTSTFNESLKIKMSETVDSTKRTLYLNCFTERSYACSNYGIQSTLQLTDNKITLNFIQIVEPGICLTSIGPASTLIKLDQLANKTYEIEINCGATKISGQLNVSAGTFTVTLPTQAKVQFVNPELGRVPENTIYGTIHYHAASTTTTVQKFVDSLQFYGATARLYPQGDYGYFLIEPNGQIKQLQDGGYYFTRYYIFNYSSNSSPLKNMVRRFGVNYPDSLLITLNTTRGEKFYSWVP